MKSKVSLTPGSCLSPLKCWSARFIGSGGKLALLPKQVLHALIGIITPSLFYNTISCGQKVMTHQNKYKTFEDNDQMIVFAHLKLAEMPELGIKSSQYPSIIWRVWVGNCLC